MFHTNRNNCSILNLWGFQIFCKTETFLQIASTDSKFKLILTNDISHWNRVLKYFLTGIICPVVNLEVSKDRILSINLYKLMNIFTKFYCWCFISTIKIDTINWFSLKGVYVQIKSFLHFCFNLRFFKDILSITKVFKGLNIKRHGPCLIQVKSKTHSSTETWECKDVFIKLKMLKPGFLTFKKVSMIHELFSRLKILMSDLSKLKVMMLLFDNFAI